MRLNIEHCCNSDIKSATFYNFFIQFYERDHTRINLADLLCEIHFKFTFKRTQENKLSEFPRKFRRSGRVCRE